MSTNAEVQQFAVNLRRAIVDRETVKVGGGEFTTTELKPVLVALKAHADLVAALQSIFEECTLVHKHWGDGCNQKQADEAIKNARAALAKATQS